MLVKNLSVFFPAYNEEGSIQETVLRAVKVLDRLKIDYEVLIIDDGSKDKTTEIADRLSNQYPRIKALHQPNGGYGMALRTGFKNSKFAWIVYSDGDGQFDFSEVTKFLEKANVADYIVGYRIKREDPFYRGLFAKGWTLSVFLLFGVWLKDIDCGFKMISKKVLEKIPPLESARGATINAELLIETKRSGFKIVQVGVSHYPRKAGKPTGASIPVIIKSYLDLLKLWWKHVGRIND